MKTEHSEEKYKDNGIVKILLGRKLWRSESKFNTPLHLLALLSKVTQTHATNDITSPAIKLELTFHRVQRMNISRFLSFFSSGDNH